MAEALSTSPCTAVEVANWFIKRGISKGDPCDQMKVHKLVYFSYAWYLGNGLGPLFEEDIEAWQYGPVVRSLYRRMHKYGMSPIEELIDEFDWIEEEMKTPMPAKKHEVFLKQIWDIYGQWSGIQLSNATHRANEPWAIMKRRNGDLRDKPIIRNSLIEQVYAKKVDEI